MAMNLALALLLCGSLPTQTSPADNLDFHTGTLAGWEGEGFYIAPASGNGPSRACGVCSSDGGNPAGTAYLHRTFVVPPGAGVLSCTAYVVRGKDLAPSGDLDVFLLASGQRIVPKQVRTAPGWKETSRILHRQERRAREYVWHLESYVGQTLRIAMLDEDKRPGCHLFCSGFRILPASQLEVREFARFMLRLTEEHQLLPVSRYDSKHFVALSNADDAFNEARLQNCELIHSLFFDHFRARGFAVKEPAGKLMLAIFDSPAGFQAYVGSAIPAGVVGLYHTPSNRLVTYDFGQNANFMAQKQKAQQAGKAIAGDLDRQRYSATVSRVGQEIRSGANIGTIMHETAHQLSFNSGLLNREGDVPGWLAEGLACYCEPTENGVWLGLGEPNPDRIKTLAGALAPGKHLPLRELVSGDAWLRPSFGGPGVLVGYGQSWALFRLLMEERPQALRTYLSLLYSRRTPDYRLADFGECFGPNLDRLEARYEEYMRQQVERVYRPTKAAGAGRTPPSNP
jgi:hypothetical protein